VYALAVVGCGERRPAPVAERVTTVETGTLLRPVNPGDTLYSIAWEADVHFHDLARWNDIRPPYVIQVGQRLRLSAPKTQPVPQAQAPERPVPPIDTPGPSVPQPDLAPAAKPARKIKPAQAATTTVAAARSVWRWPANGPLLRSFAPRRGVKGIDIAGKAGSSVRAAAPGEVVYRGSGLRGYGQLIILKHDENYLSAYAHNEKLLVDKGQKVASGQKIATMGSSGTDRVKLHFQIRRDGVPVDPARYLPRR